MKWTNTYFHFDKPTQNNKSESIMCGNALADPSKWMCFKNILCNEKILNN